jgi:type VI secretion system secreted protein VgrG
VPEYTQTDRPLKITTPLAADVLLLTALQGSEEMSQLFDFRVELLASLKSDVRFDKIIGQSVTAENAAARWE